MDKDDINECDCSEKVHHDLPENETWHCPKCDAEWWGEPATVLDLLAENAALRAERDGWVRWAAEKICEAQAEATEAERKLAETVARQLPDISTDGPNEIDDHRHWLARQLLDSKLTANEAYSIVRHFPSISKEAERG